MAKKREIIIHPIKSEGHLLNQDIETNSPWIVWGKLDLAVDFLKKHATAIDILTVVGDNSIILFGEDHYDIEIKQWLGKSAPDLKQAGISHFGIELYADLEDVIKSRDYKKLYVELKNLYPRFPDPVTKEIVKLIQKMHESGIEVITTEQLVQNFKLIDKSREQHMSNTLLSIVESQPDVKIAVLAGNDHVSRFGNAGSKIEKHLKAKNVQVSTVRILSSLGKEDLFSKAKFSYMILDSDLVYSDIMLSLVNTKPWESLKSSRELSADYLIYLGSHLKNPDNSPPSS